MNRRRLQVTVRLVNSMYARAIAWGLLLVSTAMLLRAEAVRAELPPGVKVSFDLVYREAKGGRLRLDVYEPETSKSAIGRPAVVAFHGGGWRGGSKNDYGRSLLPFVENGFVVVAVDYRLSRPGQPSWPENLEDVYHALIWVRENAKKFDIDPQRIALVGASAGANLALLLGETVADRGGATRVSAVIDFYGPTDLRQLRVQQPLTISSTSLMLGASPSDAPQLFDAASPILHIKASHPPTFLVHGQEDLLVPPSQSQTYANALERAGVFHQLMLLSDARHGFGLKVGDMDLMPQILKFLEQVWQKG